MTSRRRTDPKPPTNRTVYPRSKWAVYSATHRLKSAVRGICALRPSQGSRS